MRILLVGAGGVGGAVAAIAARRAFFEADGRGRLRPAARREGGRRRAGDPRFTAAQVDAADEAAVAALLAEHRCDALLNATDPRFVMPLFRAALAAGATTWTWRCRCPRRTPSARYEATGVKLGDEQFALAGEWEAAGAAGAGRHGRRARPVRRLRPLRRRPPVLPRSTSSACATAPTSPSPATTSRRRSRIWTTIEECLNPPVVWERDRGWFTTEPFSEPEVFDFPEGIGPVECVNVEHEEVLLMPRWVDARAGHLQVRPGRGVHRRPEDPAQARAWTAPPR